MQTASWDNSNVYKSFEDPQIEVDTKLITNTSERLNKRSDFYKALILKIELKEFEELQTSLEEMKALYRAYLDGVIHLYTIYNFASTAVSVNTKDEVAKSLQSKMEKILVEMNNAIKPLQLCLYKAPADIISQFVDDNKTRELTFYLSKERKFIDHLLNVNEEMLLSTFSLDGLTAWGKLYDNISGAMKVDLDGEKIGLSKANNFYSHPDRNLRQKAYRGINKAWQEQEISANAILNSINGWRNENFKVRSTKKELHYLDQACHSAHIKRETLNALMEAASLKKSFGQEVLDLMAHELKIEKMAPWDLMAPAPYQSSKNSQESKITYPEAIALIKAAFSEVNPEMAAFAQHMFDKKWIDCSPGENRAQGAYCTGFVRVNEPRVFMTYDGSMKNVITLAHEIGHAYHNWVMSDIPLVESQYPMTLAETASIFAETVVRDYLVRKSQSKEELLAISWQDIQSIQSLLINIPARFEFEKNFVEARMKKTLSVEETKDLMIAAQKTWYGETLSEYDEMFWASKLHFSMSGRSFYNYPYTFGYLFSLGIYSKKDSMGADFHSKYVALLRDTGRMSAEDLVLKHFNEDITKKEFWLKSIAIVEKSFEHFKSMLKPTA